MKNFLARALSLLAMVAALAAPARAQDLRYPLLKTVEWTQRSGSITSHLVDLNTDAVEFIGQAREAATFTHLCVYLGAKNGTPPTYKIAMEGVNTATGRANGTIKTGTGECSWSDVLTSFAANTLHCFPVTGTTCSVARGENVAVTVRYASGTINGSNYASFGVYQSDSFTDGSDRTQPLNIYGVTVAGGTGTKQAQKPIFGWSNATRRFGNLYSAHNNHTFSSDSTPDEYALRFQVPCPSGQTYKLSGVQWFGQTPSSGKTVLIRLYDGTTPLQDVTYYGDISVGSAGNNRIFEQFFDETDLSALSCGTTYRIGFAPQQTSSNFALQSYDVPSNDDFDAWPLGKETYTSTRSDAGAWTDVTTRRVWVNLFIDKLDTVSGGGGAGGSKLNSGLN